MTFPRSVKKTKERLLFTGALVIPIDSLYVNMFKRLCNRNLKSCKQFTAINIHSLHAVEFGSVTTFEQMKKNLDKKKVTIDVQGESNTAKQRRLTRLLVLFRRHTRDKNRRVQNLPVKKNSNRSEFAHEAKATHPIAYCSQATHPRKPL